MQYKYYFDAVNRTLYDICGADDNTLFGNIPIILGGHFAQILPVERKGNHSATVIACLQRSILWSNINVLALHQNIQVRYGEANMIFANWLRRLSYPPHHPGTIPLSNFILFCNTIDDLCAYVFPTSIMRIAHSNPATFVSPAILAMRNDKVGAINQKVLE